MLRGKSSCLGAQHRPVRFKAAAVAGRDRALSAASPTLTKAQSGDFPAHLWTPGSQHQTSCTQGIFIRDLPEPRALLPALR